MNVKVAQRSLSFCSPFLFVSNFFFCSFAGKIGVWNCLLESSVSCRCCRCFSGQLGPVQPMLLDTSHTSLQPHGRLGSEKVSTSLWEISHLHERKEEKCLFLSLLYFGTFRCHSRGWLSYKQVSFLWTLSFSIFQEWLLQAPNCGCVWEWQLPSALQSTGIRHCSVLAGGSSLSCAGWELDHPWSQVGTRMALTKGDPWKWPLLSNWGVVK